MRHIQLWFVFMLTVTACAVCFFVFILSERDVNHDHLNVWAPWEPYDADPMKFDTLIHLVAFRSVQGSLVSSCRAGSITAQISDKWSVSEDGKEWLFHIRDGITFENGDRIAPEHVVASLTRIAYLLRQNQSHSDLFDAIDGADVVAHPLAKIKGLQAAGDSVVIKLTKPYPRMLETLSLGLYSVVHPSDYDHITGKWKDAHRLTSGSAYKIKEWSRDHVTLELRHDYPPGLVHPRRLQTINISWSPDKRMDADMIIGDSNDSTHPGDYMFRGSAPTAIAYTRCFTGSTSDSVCNSHENRIAIRRLIYESMKQANVTPVRSFLPLILSGTSEINEDDMPEGGIDRLKGKKITFFIRNKTGNAIFRAIRENFAAACAKYGITANEVDLNSQEYVSLLSGELQHAHVDLGFFATEISIADAKWNIEFMFLTKEGVRFPDTDGRIKQELREPQFNPQRINELMWDQSIIMPLGHYAMGFWASKRIDASWLNTTVPIIEFQWLGRQ